MKAIQYYLLATLALAFTLASLSAEVNTSSTSSSQSESIKKTVSITNVNGVTTKTTTIIRNGKKEVITEVTGADGQTKTTREGGDDAAPNDGDDKEVDPEAQKNKPWLGVRVKELDATIRPQLKLSDDEGVVVDLVAKDSPATAADIRVGDILLSLAETSVSTPEELQEEIDKHKAGDIVELNYLRKGERKTVQVTLAARPANKPNDKPGGNGGNNQGFENILDNPNISEDFKKKVREMMKKAKASKDGTHTEKFSISHNGENLDEILNDPQVPESFKKMVREMMKKMEDFKNKK